LGWGHIFKDNTRAVSDIDIYKNGLLVPVCIIMAFLSVVLTLRSRRERERVRKDSIRVEVKRKHLGESERRFMSEGGKRASC
jgi:hypothetical protein